MGIIIQSEKISKVVRDSLARGVRPDLCIKTVGGCRIGLYAQTYSAARGDVTALANDSRVSYISKLDYGRYCEKENGRNYVVHFVVKDLASVQANLDRSCDPTRETGGFPPAKSIAQQFIEGLYKLATTNPAVIACLYTQGLACPLIAALPLDAATKASLLNAWKTAAGVGLFNEIKRLGQALGVNMDWLVYTGDTGAPPPLPYPSPSSPCTVRVSVAGLYISGEFPATRNPDGSYSVRGSLPFIGSISFTIDFRTCNVQMNTSGVVVSQRGRSAGAQKCAFDAKYGGSTYTVTVELLGECNGITKDKEQQEQQWLIIGGLAFLALVGLIMLSR